MTACARKRCRSARRLTHLRDGLAESHVLDGAEVYLDGFLSYTPQELAIIEVMLSSGVPLTAAVICDVELPMYS